MFAPFDLFLLLLLKDHAVSWGLVRYFYLFYMPNPVFFSLYQTWKSLSDSHEVAKDLPNAVITSVEATREKLATTNLFYVAGRVLKDTNQEVKLLGLGVFKSLSPSIKMLL